MPLSNESGARAAPIRGARPDEAARLSDLALRSKAYWGYDAEFLRACIPALTLTLNGVGATPMFVWDEDGRIAGFYGIEVTGDEAEVTNLFVEPDAIGRGIGTALWNHLVETARRFGAQTIRIEADPHAAGFYERCGAVLVGDAPSDAVAGRSLPPYRFAVEGDPTPSPSRD